MPLSSYSLCSGATHGTWNTSRVDHVKTDGITRTMSEQILLIWKGSNTSSHSVDHVNREGEPWGSFLICILIWLFVIPAVTCTATLFKWNTTVCELMRLSVWIKSSKSLIYVALGWPHFLFMSLQEKCLISHCLPGQAAQIRKAIPSPNRQLN